MKFKVKNGGFRTICGYPPKLDIARKGREAPKMPRITLRQFNVLAKVSLFFIVGIVITGAAVRLTGSGLGCTDWPRCNESKFVDVSTHHGRIEQVNRLFTGVVGVAVILAMVGAQRLATPIRRLRILGALLVLGVLGQVVLGGIVVLTGLNPFANMGHFALSMFLVGINVALVVGSESVVAQPTLRIRRDLNVLVLLLTAVLVAGMVVTGSGPHAGDEEAVRFGVAIETATRVHSVLVWMSLAWLVYILMRFRKSRDGGAWFESRINQVTVVLLAQGAVGYWQYFTDVPAGLVAVHIALATVLWALTIRLWIESRTSGSAEEAVSNGQTNSTSDR